MLFVRLSRGASLFGGSMIRYLGAGLLSLCLAGCSPWLNTGQGWPGSGTQAGHYDFNWQLSGDPMVAPLQVFSGAGRTWLQFAPGRTPPALFAQTPEGLTPLPYHRQDPYIIVDGVWPALVLQGGRYIARVERHVPPPSLPAILEAPASGPDFAPPLPPLTTSPPR